MNSSLWDRVVGQPRAVSLLSADLARGAAHAYLLTGPRGTGRGQAARVFAAILLCPDRGCGVCDTCTRVLRGVHPDVSLVEPDGPTLTRTQVMEELRRPATLRPLEGSHKVFIVREADSMTDAAANAFLKVLEEPPEGVVFMLLAESRDSCKGTIVSRCRQVPFGAVPPDALAAVLEAEFGVGAAQAVLVARLATGVPGRARRMLADDPELTRYQRIAAIMRDLPGLDDLGVEEAAGAVLALVDEAKAELEAGHKTELEQALETTASPAHRSRVQKTLEARHKRARRRGEQEALGFALDVVSLWLRDLMVAAEGADGRLIVNAGYAADIASQARSVGSERARQALEFVRETRQALGYNVGAHLALEVLLFSVQEVVR